MSRLFFIPQAVRIDSTGTPFASAEANFHLTGTTTDTDTYTNNARTVAHANPVIADAAGQFPAIYLDPAITYRCIITQASAGAQIDDIDPVHAPIIAADIPITDAGALLTATEVEAALQELAADWGKLSATNTWTADQTLSANLLMADNEIQRSVLIDYGVGHNAVSSSSGTVVLDLTTGNSFVTTLTENITTVTISNPSASGTEAQFTWRIIQDGGGGAFTVAQPASVIVAAGGTWTVTTSNNARDKGVYSTIDGGTIWELEFLQAYA